MLARDRLLPVNVVDDGLLEILDLRHRCGPESRAPRELERGKAVGLAS
jgi:hypothetical protein